MCVDILCGQIGVSSGFSFALSVDRLAADAPSGDRLAADPLPTDGLTDNKLIDNKLIDNNLNEKSRNLTVDDTCGSHNPRHKAQNIQSMSKCHAIHVKCIQSIHR